LSGTLASAAPLAGVGLAGGMAVAELLGRRPPAWRWAAIAIVTVLCTVGGAWAVAALAAVIIPLLVGWSRRETSQYAGLSAAGARRQNFHHLHLTAVCLIALAAAAVTSIAVPAVDFGELGGSVLVGCVAGSYCLAGLAKLRRRGWADPRLMPLYQHLLAWFRAGDGGAPAAAPSRVQRLIAGRPALVLALLLELAAPVMVVGGWPLVVVVSALIGFHLAIRVVLQISFRENVAILAGLLVSGVVST
jgi:hypothetical protein